MKHDDEKHADDDAKDNVTKLSLHITYNVIVQEVQNAIV